MGGCIKGGLLLVNTHQQLIQHALVSSTAGVCTKHRYSLSIDVIHACHAHFRLGAMPYLACGGEVCIIVFVHVILHFSFSQDRCSCSDSVPPHSVRWSWWPIHRWAGRGTRYIHDKEHGWCHWCREDPTLTLHHMILFLLWTTNNTVLKTHTCTHKGRWQYYWLMLRCAVCENFDSSVASVTGLVSLSLTGCIQHGVSLLHKRSQSKLKLSLREGKRGSVVEGHSRSFIILLDTHDPDFTTWVTEEENFT